MRGPSRSPGTHDEHRGSRGNLLVGSPTELLNDGMRFAPPDGLELARKDNDLIREYRGGGRLIAVRRHLRHGHDCNEWRRASRLKDA